MKLILDPRRGETHTIHIGGSVTGLQCNHIEFDQKDIRQLSAMIKKDPEKAAAYMDTLLARFEPKYVSSHLVGETEC